MGIRDELKHRIAGERQAFARSVGSLAKRGAVVCEAHCAASEAASMMLSEDVGSVVVVDAQGRPVGIVTTRDLVAVVAQDRAERPVSEFMSTDLVTLPPSAFAYEAALAMTEHRIRHILLLEHERLVGVVSERDLFALQRLGLGELTMEIRLAAGIGTLQRLAGEVRRLAALLIEQGTAPEPLTLFISVLNDRITERVIEVARKRHDLDRIRWAWLAFGSEGRFEQTFSTDQDNGMIFAPHEDVDKDSARQRLVEFARDVNEGLDACGFPLCEGNVMASNPALCLTLDEWQAKVERWLAATVPQALLDAAICFDVRSIYGDASLADTLSGWIAERVRSQPAFLRHLAQAATRMRPSLGSFGSFRLDAVPGAGRTINLKANGVRIFVDAARVLALAYGRRETSTAARLRAVREARGDAAAETEALIDAFYFIQSLRLARQARLPGGARGARRAEEDYSNRIDPDRLNAFERAALKESFRLARKLQRRLELDFQL
jgi:CBS domain-containing protein